MATPEEMNELGQIVQQLPDDDFAYLLSLGRRLASGPLASEYADPGAAFADPNAGFAADPNAGGFSGNGEAAAEWGTPAEGFTAPAQEWPTGDWGEQQPQPGGFTPQPQPGGFAAWPPTGFAPQPQPQPPKFQKTATPGWPAPAKTGKVMPKAPQFKAQPGGW